MDETTERRRVGGFIAAGVLALLGTAVVIFASAYRFLGYVTVFAAALVLCFALLRLLRRSHKNVAKALRLTLIGLILWGLIAAGVTAVPIAQAAAGDKGAACEYIVVLGAQVDGTVPSVSLRERVDAAYRYLIANPNASAVVSGGMGAGEDISEAACMFDMLTARGIAPERILLEDRATDTRENIACALAVIEASTGARPARIGIVTSEYHLYRAKMFASGQGVAAVGIPARTGNGVLLLSAFLREIAAVWYYSVF